MSRRAWAAVGLALLLLAGAMLFAPEVGPSVDSLDPRGLRLAWRALEEEGRPVARFGQRWTSLEETAGTLVVAMPLEEPPTGDERQALRSWVLQGGSLLLLTSGREPAYAERALLELLGIQGAARPEVAPLGWFGWKAWYEEEVALVPAPGIDLPAIQVRRGEWRTMPAGASTEPLLVDPLGRPAVWRQAEGAGQITVVDPGAAFSNAWLSPEGLTVLTAIVDEAVPTSFDEAHHGNFAPGVATGSPLGGPFELVLAQVVLLYLVGLWALGRRFGPAMGQAGAQASSASRDLGALARLHARAGHSREAAAQLRRLATARARRLGLDPAGLDLPAGDDEAGLLALAKVVGERQSTHRL